MGKATNETIKTRVAALKGLILSGSSNSTCVEHAAQQWGLSRRQSYRLLKRAWAEVREDVHSSGVDRQEMVCWTIHQLMTAAGEASNTSSHPSLLALAVNWTRSWGLVTTAVVVVLVGAVELGRKASCDRLPGVNPSLRRASAVTTVLWLTRLT